MNDRKIKMIFIITAITTLLLGLIGVTFAYFSSESQIANEFNAGKYKTTATESFVSPTNWKPGDTTPKTLTVKNEGDIDMYVRVSYTESWKSKNNEDLPLEQDGNRAAIINLDNQSDWTKRGNYYYYKNVLHPNDETNSLISGVTFNQNVVGDYECIKEGDKTTCSSTGDSYEGGTYTLTFNIETVQSDAKDEVWPNPIQYVNRQNEGQITTGDEIAIDTEHFYVVSSDENETVLLSKYNLLVGDIFDYDDDTGNYTLVKTLSSSDTGYGLQNSEAKGSIPLETGETTARYVGTVAFSGTNYWDNSVCEYMGTNWGCTGTSGLLSEYANASNVEEATSYTSPYPYVYRSNIGDNISPQIVYDPTYGDGYAQNNGYTISYFVEQYKNKLIELGAPNTIAGRLLSEEEAVSLGCSESDNWCSSTDLDNNPVSGTAPTWVYSSSYWLGSAGRLNSMWFVYSGGDFAYTYFVYDNSYGVRPAIIVRTSDI